MIRFFRRTLCETGGRLRRTVIEKHPTLAAADARY